MMFGVCGSVELEVLSLFFVKEFGCVFVNTERLAEGLPVLPVKVNQIAKDLVPVSDLFTSVCSRERR